MADTNIPLDISLLAEAFIRLKSQGVREKMLDAILDAIKKLTKDIITN